MASVNAGLRVGDLDDDPWGQARIELRANRHVQLELAAGRYPRDLTGFTDGLFLQGGVRLSIGSASPPVVILPSSPVRIERLDEQRVRINLRFDGTPSELAIAGDFSEWAPVPLQPQPDGSWAVVDHHSSTPSQLPVRP